ncbi:hypothetical protein GALL_354400 [mine drainage metagenome]|uniref:Uncharacterized protein n=1 Tax=mine drainage metagenome TaxID=410659 RepID=A0A1J5QSA6_9ZZZZ
MHGVDRAAGSQRGNGGEQPGVRDAEARFLAFHVAAGLHGGHRLIGTQSGEYRIALLLEGHRADRKHQEDQRHGREYRPALTRIARHAAKGNTERSRDQENGQHLEEIRQGCRILERMSRVGVKESATVCTDHFYRFLGGDRPHRQSLCLRRGRLRHGIALFVLDGLAGSVKSWIVVFRNFQCRHVLVGIKILNDALAHQKHGKDQ